MKNQYVGDINDYGKYGLLRFLAGKGIRIGINWYLTENDSTGHGKDRDYLHKTTERYLDPELFDELRYIAFQDDKSVKMIETAGLIPGALFYNQVLNSHAAEMTLSARETERTLWFSNSKIVLGDAELIFADPDNGLTTTKTARTKESEKYILPEEIVEYYYSGKNVVYYCHKGRRSWEDWEKAKADVKKMVRDAKIAVLTYRKGRSPSFVFVLHPDDYINYMRLIGDFDRTDWHNSFTREYVDGKIPGSEKIGDPFEVTMKDGTVISLARRADGEIELKSTRRPNETRRITPEMLEQYLHLY